MTEYKYKVSIETETEEDLRSMVNAVAERFPVALPSTADTKSAKQVAETLSTTTTGDEVKAFVIGTQHFNSHSGTIRVAVVQNGLRLFVNHKEVTTISNTSVAKTLDNLIAVLTYIRANTYKGVKIDG